MEPEHETPRRPSVDAARPSGVEAQTGTHGNSEYAGPLFVTQMKITFPTRRLGAVATGLPEVKLLCLLLYLRSEVALLAPK